MSSIPDKLRQIREAHGWSQRDAARALGLQRRRVQEIEAGAKLERVQPTGRLIRLLAARPELAGLLEEMARDDEKEIDAALSAP